MNFRAEYTVALSDFVGDRRALVPRRAIQLGQQASAEGLSALAILNIHDDAVERIEEHRSTDAAASHTPSSEFVSRFFRESLAAYEAANAQLTRQNGTLLQLNEALETQASRIARALHADAGQLLNIACLKLAEAEQNTSSECAGYLTETRALCDKMDQQLLNFSHGLQPAVLQECGLVSALDFLVKGVVGRTGLDIRIEGTNGLSVAKHLETMLYRFVQEALTNIVKHARATNVVVRFRETGELLTCTVADDGVGFKAATCRPGMGLSGMRRRVQAAAGKLTLTSNPGFGAQLTVEIPLRDSSPWLST